ncbi:hypothetical protein FBUS_10396 [Fasciolopsis buskii]|uniref:ZSWIM3 N-terminal domain-containing protein n=1 Tax=Fasciolopsis buskii TaxID=27845 RepID=A0A8E0RXG6_9TREM|nr:hypothetical protein FBUS_10396 [Fasciolopsis buski]
MSFESRFLEVFCGRDFTSYEEFDEVLKAFMKETFCNFVLRTCVKDEHSILRYSKMHYLCSRRKPRPTNSKGVRLVKTKSTGCPARFTVNAQGPCLRVTSFFAQHNHPLNEQSYKSHPLNKRLTPEEASEARHILQFCPDVQMVKEFVEARFGKHLSTNDVYNITRKKPCKESS